MEQEIESEALSGLVELLAADSGSVVQSEVAVLVVSEGVTELLLRGELMGSPLAWVGGAP